MPKVLIVEDDPSLAAAYGAICRHADLAFRLATDGHEALRVLRQWVPEVIVLDIVMPYQGGLATLAAIKKDSALQHIPVIVASNLDQKHEMDKALAAGASECMVKSNSSPDELVERIRKLASTHTPRTA